MSARWREMITSDPQVMHGQACIKGTRIPVSLVLDNLAGGLNDDEIIAQFPSLSPADIRASLAYAAELVRDEGLSFPATTG